MSDFVLCKQNFEFVCFIWQQIDFKDHDMKMLGIEKIQQQTRKLELESQHS